MRPHLPFCTAITREPCKGCDAAYYRFTFDPPWEDEPINVTFYHHASEDFEKRLYTYGLSVWKNLVYDSVVRYEKRLNDEKA